MVVIFGITAAVLYLTSTLNPFLYCWKIVESVSLLLEDQSSKTSSKADKSDEYFAFHGVILLLSRAGVTRAS